MARELPHEATIICVDNEPIGYSEKRGLDEIFLRIGGTHPVNPFNRLVGLARSELKGAGQKTDLEILDSSSTEPAALRDALSSWIADIITRQRRSGKPFLFSRMTNAARFLAEQQMLMIDLKHNAHGLSLDRAVISRMKSACRFANAWHYWAREISGEHGRAYEGTKAAENRAKGPGVKRASKESRRTLILRIVGEVIDDRAVACKVIAGQIKRVNRALGKGGRKRFKTESALCRELQRIREDRRGVGK